MPAKPKPAPAPWRSRIVGYGEESPGALLANPFNFRTHNAAQKQAMGGVLREVGVVQNVLVNKTTGHIIDGHLRTAMAITEGQPKVPITYVELSEEEEKLILATFDPISAMAGTDQKKLLELVSNLSVGDDALRALLGMCGPAGLTDPDAVPEAPAEPVSALGDLWLCGAHRVLCGDATEPDAVELLMGDARINLAFTSPPYAEQREYDQSSGFRPIPPDGYVRWFEPVSKNIRASMHPDGSFFLNIKPSCEGPDTELYVFDLVLAHARQWGWHFATEFCWERNGVPKSVTQRFKNQFEPVYQFTLGRWKMRPQSVRHYSDSVPTAGGPGSGETSWARKQGGYGAHSVSGSFGAAKKRRNGTNKMISDVQGRAHDAGEYIGSGLAYPGNRLPTFTATHQATGHAAAFPVGLPDFFIRAFSDDGDCILDPFAGSGSTIIAAEQTNRIGHGIEISPAYVDVIVTRWQNFTGKEAKLEDGRSFREVAHERTMVAA